MADEPKGKVGRAVRKLVTAAVLTALFPFACSGLGYGMGQWKAAQRTRPVGSVVPTTFPVLVVTRGESGEYEPHVVYHEDLAAFLETQRDYSFLVPPDQEEELNALLARTMRSALNRVDGPTPEIWTAEFAVGRIDGGQQRVELTTSFDDRVNAGTYRATESGIVPLQFQSYNGMSIGFSSLLQAVPATVALYAIGIAVYAYLASRRKVPAQPG